MANEAFTNLKESRDALGRAFVRVLDWDHGSPAQHVLVWKKVHILLYTLTHVAHKLHTYTSAMHTRKQGQAAFEQSHTSSCLKWSLFLCQSRPTSAERNHVSFMIYNTNIAFLHFSVLTSLNDPQLIHSGVMFCDVLSIFPQ